MTLDPQGPCKGWPSNVRPGRTRQDCHDCALYAFAADGSHLDVRQDADGTRYCANRRAHGALHQPQSQTPANAGTSLAVGVTPEGRRTEAQA